MTKITLVSAFPVQMGGFADVFIGRYENRVVALKRLRFVMSMSEPDREDVLKVYGFTF